MLAWFFCAGLFCFSASPSSAEPIDQQNNNVAMPQDYQGLKNNNSVSEEQVKTYKAIMQEILHLLLDWGKAWQASAGKEGTMDTYSTFYSEKFKTDRFDKRAWVADKALKNKRKEWIKLVINDVQVKLNPKLNKVKVSMLLDYKSSNYSDLSPKVLFIDKKDTGWKIVSEAQ